MLDTDFAVVDLETTGFAPLRGDRIIEVAVLRCRPGAGVVDRFVTLVDPQRPLGAASVHRLAERDVRAAPRFADIAGDLRARFDCTVLVAHNSRFDVGFLQAEFARAGQRLLDRPTLCTIALTSHLGVPSAGRSLTSCCAAFGISHETERAHGAEYDARATARLLLCLLREAKARGMTTLASLGCSDPAADAMVEPAAAHTTASCPPGRTPSPAPPLPRVAMAVRRLAAESPLGDPVLSAYLDLVDRVLLDRVITTAEADALTVMARRCDLTPDAVSDAHAHYVTRLARVAWDDGVLSDDEQRDVMHVAALLNVPQTKLDDALQPEGTAWKQ